MFSAKLTAEQRLQKAVGRILHEDRYKPLAGILMLGTRTVCDSTPTACTNGRDEKYGRAFIESLTDAALRFVIIHECYHKMYRHLITWKHLMKIDAQRANAAMDYVINLRIKDENSDGFCTMPNIDGKEVGLIDEKYRGMDTAQVFKLLKQDQNQDQDQDQDSNGNGSGNGNGNDNFDEHDWEGAQDMGPEEARQLEQEIDNAIRQGAMAAGKMGINADRMFGDLLEVQVDWREVLREFITATCAGKDYSTWSRPNRRFMGAGVYLPSSISERVDELCIAVDTSGSISDDDLRVMLTEVKGICDNVKPDKVRLLYWGHEVVRDEEYEFADLEKIIQSTRPKGGGGTDVECVVKYMRKHHIAPQATIVITDGDLYAGWGQWSQPVLWAVLDNKKATPTCGKVLHINSNQIR